MQACVHHGNHRKPWPAQSYLQCFAGCARHRRLHSRAARCQTSCMPGLPNPHSTCSDSSSSDSSFPLDTSAQRQAGCMTTPLHAPALPTFLDGINWYCYCCLGLLFLTDFTPVGQWLLGSGTATTATAATTAVTTAAAKAAAPPAGGGFAVKLALLQWGLFVLPSFAWVQRRGWDMLQTFKLRPAGMRHYITGLVAGPLLWLLLHVAVAVKTGNSQQLLPAASHGSTTVHLLLATGSLEAAAAAAGAAPASAAAAGATSAAATPAAAAAGTVAAGGGAAAAGAAGSTPGQLLLGLGAASSSGQLTLQQLLQLVLVAAVSPAVAEELLLRGLFLTAALQRLGSMDAVAVSAALFALMHLDLQQFFQFCILGGACGLLAARSSSVGPAMVLHAAFNATAMAVGLLMHR